MTVPNLDVRTAVGGFIDPHRPRVSLGRPNGSSSRRTPGQVRLVEDGVIGATVLDLGSQLLLGAGIARHRLAPRFRRRTTSSTSSGAARLRRRRPTLPSSRRWSSARTRRTWAPDSEEDLEAPLLGNRVDRFVWDAETSTLTLDLNLIKLRSFQNDAAPVPPNQGDEEQPARGNHDGGVIRSGRTESSM